MTRFARRFRVMASILALVAGFSFLTAISALGSLVQAASSVTDKNQRSLSFLFDGLKSARSQQQSRLFEDEIWKLWLKAPDEQTQALLNKALERRRWYDFASAKLLLDEVINRHPGYCRRLEPARFHIVPPGKFRPIVVRSGNGAGIRAPAFWCIGWSGADTHAPGSLRNRSKHSQTSSQTASFFA